MISLKARSYGVDTHLLVVVEPVYLLVSLLKLKLSQQYTL